MRPLCFLALPRRRGSTEPVDGMVELERAPDGTGRGPGHRLVRAGAGAPGGGHDRTWAVVTDPGEVEAAARAGFDLWLRGTEAAGPIGDCSALVLIRAAARTGRAWVVEGLGERGQAAALAVGAAGVVLDGPLYACAGQLDLPGVESGRDTLVIGELAGQRARVLSRGDPRVPQLAHLDAAAIAGALPACVPVPQSVGGCAEWAGQPVEVAARALFERILARAERSRVGHGLLDDPLGTGRPVVQGPMANVSERPDLGRDVLAAGGLPFCALGALAPDDARGVVAAHAELPRWGAGVIGFDLMPHRDAHLALLQEHRPAAITLAGGSVALARRLLDEGQAPWLHTPDGSMVEAALREGLPAVILEGHEAGGHVGALTSAGLWEEALARAEAAPGATMVVLAGGIGDAVSAAFAGAMAADARQAGHPTLLQVGTALFFTHEIVEHEQIPLAYQAAALSADHTELVGSSVNLPLRVVRNAFAEEARELERRWIEQGLPRAVRRSRLEQHNLGRARIAARAIERDPSGASRYRAVSSRRQLDEGALTMGEGATVQRELTSVADLLAELTERAAAWLRRGGPPRSRGEVTSELAQEPTAPSGSAGARSAIAIVGMGCVLPGALDVPTYWEMLLRGVDAVGPVPADRWAEGRYVGDAPGQTPSRHAGAVRGFVFDPLPFRIPPAVVPSMDRAQQLALEAARQAVVQAGWLEPGGVDRRRSAVILGNSMGGEHAKSLAVRIRFREVLAAVAADPLTAPWSGDDLDGLSERVEARLAEELPPVDVESMAGLLGNVIAGRVAAWLDWRGGNFTVDAACAASLAAVAVAVEQLRSGRIDAALAGGVDADLSPETYVGFARTHALTRTGSSPFATTADGFVMGEGAAVLALMRLDDAEARGAPIWAVIDGVGQASDGRGKGITAPLAEGQDLAVSRAWADAGYGAERIGAVEAHGTGTALGDRTEAGVLARRFSGRRAWLGSVKSNIGHLKGGAGAAGLVKAALCAATGVVPPTLHAAPPSLGASPLALPRTPSPLGAPSVAVSAFGFGGTDFHVVVGPPPAGPPATLHVPPTPVARSWREGDRCPTVSCYAADDRDTLLERVRTDRPCEPEALAGAARRAVVICDDAERQQVLARVGAWLATSPPSGASLGREATWAEGPPQAPVWLFPGQGSQRVGALDAASLCWPGHRARLALGAPDGTPLAAWEAQDGALAIHLALFAAGVAWAATLRDAGVPCAATLGHSLGAFPSLVASEHYAVDDALALVLVRGRALEACPEGAMVAVRLSAEEARVAAEAHGLALAAVNGPASCVLAGSVAAVEAAERALSDARPKRIPVPRAYHSPSVEPAVRALAEALVDRPRMRGTVPCWSARTGRPFGDDLAHDLARAIADPVRFDDALTGLLQAGHTLFVECGPGTVLSRLVQDRGAVSIPLDADGNGLPFAAAALAAQGHPQLLLALPGTVARRGLPAVVPTPWPRPDGGTVPARARPSPPPSAPAPVAALPTDDLHAAVLDAICEVTGYPREVLSSSASLDADLGVDSIRKMDVLGRLEQRLGFRAPEAELAGLADVDVEGLVAWVRARLPHGDAPRPRDVEPGGHRFERVEARPPLSGSALPDLPPAQLLAWLRDQGEALSGQRLRGDHRRAQAIADGWSLCARREGLAVQGPVDAVEPWWPETRAGLRHGAVILATGGARGILGPCLHALADLEPLTVVLSRTGDAPEGATGLACDLTDPAAVRAAVSAVVARHGRIDVVLHAAGALADGPWATRTDADAAHVLGAKLFGADHLAEALPAPVDLWVDFGSVVAWAGNAGQGLYAAANRALSASTRPAARHLTIGWTAWSEVGMAARPALQRLLASRGVVSLTPAEGGRAFRELVDSDAEGTLLVWAEEGRALPLDPSDPALADHALAGRPLVPAAWWVAAVAEAAPGRALSLHVDVPSFVTAPRVARLRVSEDRWRVELGGTVVARGEWLAGEVPPSVEPLAATEDASAHYRPDRLFHGPSWQVLRRVGFERDRCAADAELPPTHPLASLVDAAHQLLCLASLRRDRPLVLPVGAAAWAGLDPAPGPVHIDASIHLHDHGLTADLVARAPDGRVVAFARGVEMALATGSPRA